MRSPLNNAEKVLVVLPSWVGDLVMCTPSLRALRAALPQARIEVLAKPALAAVLEGLSCVDASHAHMMKGWLGPCTGAGKFRAMKFNAVLLFPNSPRSALFALATGAPTRIGWGRDGRSWMLTHALKAPKDRRARSAVDWYADLTAWATQRPVTEREVRLACSDAERAAAAKLLQGLARPIIILNPGANRSDKRWPAQKFGQLATRLITATKGSVAVTGSPEEKNLVSSVIVHSGNTAVNLIDRGVTLGSLKAAIADANLLITNDTGPRHLAAGVQTPCVSLFGPTDPRWAALHETPGSTRELQLLAEPFLPTEIIADRVAKFCAIDRIGVGDVTHAALRLLQNFRR